MQFEMKGNGSTVVLRRICASRYSVLHIPKRAYSSQDQPHSIETSPLLALSVPGSVTHTPVSIYLCWEHALYMKELVKSTPREHQLYSVSLLAPSDTVYDALAQ